MREGFGGVMIRRVGLYEGKGGGRRVDVPAMRVLDR